MGSTMTPRNACRIGHPRFENDEAEESPMPGCVYCDAVDPGLQGCQHCGRGKPETLDDAEIAVSRHREKLHQS